MTSIDWQKSGKKKPLPPNPTFRDIRNFLYLDQKILEEKAGLRRFCIRDLEAGKPVTREEAEKALAALTHFANLPRRKTSPTVTYTLENVGGIVLIGS
jgi:hypothetical protein